MPSSANTREHDHELFAEFSRLADGDPRRLAIRTELISDHLALVSHVARKFANRGEPLDDLIQVGTIGLIKAIDRFEPDKGFEFSTFAMPTIVGEIKRHFRDKTWAVRVPRRLQELGAAVSKTATELTQKLDRSPTLQEIATALKVDLDEVVEAINANSAHSTVSLDATVDPDAPSLGSRFGTIDEALEGVEYRESLKPLLLALPEREKDILIMRFFENKSQTEIARTLGISQMHVSRILAQTLTKLRTSLQD
ncbi:MAG: RNA polymerase sigma factor SigF [Actinobacteria bacterium]|nr:RNA polymerase sigma factor SigF [Actinomycetota bacterium]NBY14995.1 RNA polymerase sigma factor SigF [Actinomycetota bacterium]